MSTFSFILFGLLPSFVWLAYYLKKDRHPEPGRMIVKVFLMGMFTTIPAHLIEPLTRPAFLKITLTLRDAFHLSKSAAEAIFYLLFFTVGVALLEELLKYAVVYWGVYANPELDEPFDLILYMIVAALGFAALENILKFYEMGDPAISQVAALSLFRFTGATFLHALASGVLGYFMVLAWHVKKHAGYFALGLFLVIVLHGLFDFFIIRISDRDPIGILYPVIILIILGVMLGAGFAHVKKMKSVCEA